MAATVNAGMTGQNVMRRGSGGPSLSERQHAGCASDQPAAALSRTVPTAAGDGKITRPGGDAGGLQPEAIAAAAAAMPPPVFIFRQ